MGYLAGGRRAVAGMVLCLVMAVMSVASSLCPACDGLPGPHAGHAPSAGKMLPVTNDDCNGVCSCCGFHWLPAVAASEQGTMVVGTLPMAADEGGLSGLREPAIQPPRG